MGDGGGRVSPNIFDWPMLKPLKNYFWLCAFSLCSPPPPTLTRNRRRWLGVI